MYEQNGPTILFIFFAVLILLQFENFVIDRPQKGSYILTNQHTDEYDYLLKRAWFVKQLNLQSTT